MGKLYGGILIYEIWKTTRFSNLEILAKMEKEMASKLEKEGVAKGEVVEETSPRSDAANLLEENLLGEQMEEEREEYDQYDDDPNFSNRQRDFYNQRSDSTASLFTPMLQDGRAEEQEEHNGAAAEPAAPPEAAPAAAQPAEPPAADAETDKL